MHTIIERPAKFCMAMNDIRYVYTVTDLTRAGLFFQVKLVIGTAEYLFDLKPNSDGKVYVYIQKYVYSHLSYVLPGNTLFTAANNSHIDFYVHSREVTDADTNPSWNEHEATKPRTALKLGVEKHRFSRDNLIQKIISEKLYLTWQPSHRMVYLDQPNYLTVFLQWGNTTNTKLVINWAATDGTTGTINTNFSSLSTYLVHINTTATALGVVAATTGKVIYWYNVAVVRNISGSDVTVANSYTYYINYNYRYHWQDFIYINSLCGIDTIRAEGVTQLVPERKFEETETQADINDWNSVIKSKQFSQNNILFNRQYKGDIGYRDTMKEQYVLLEFMLSKAIYQLIDGRYVPVLYLSKTASLSNSEGNDWNFPIEWSLAEDNEVFTDDIALGIVTDTETYP